MGYNEILNDEIKNSCGAVCIKIIMERHGIKESTRSIFENISGCESGIKVCKSVLMLRYLQGRGFQTNTVSVTNLEEALKICSENRLDVILHIRSSLYNICGHYVVFSHLDPKNIFIIDPANETEITPVNLDVFKELLTPYFFSDVARKNTLTVINMNIKKTPESLVVYRDFDEDTFNYKDYSFTMFDCIIRYVSEFLDPLCDRWITI